MGIPRHRIAGLLTILLLLCAVCMMPVPLSAALSPTVNTSYVRDFARLTFTWPEQVRFRVQPINQGVTLTFNKPTSIDIGAIRKGLGGNISSATVSPDGLSVTLNFSKPFRIRHFISGNANGVDLIGASQLQAKEPPSATPPASPKLVATPPPTLSSTPNAAPKPTAAPAKPAENAPNSIRQPPAQTANPAVNLQHQPLSKAQEKAVANAAPPAAAAPKPVALTAQATTPEPAKPAEASPLITTPSELPKTEVQKPAPEPVAVAQEPAEKPVDTPVAQPADASSAPMPVAQEPAAPAPAAVASSQEPALTPKPAIPEATSPVQTPVVESTPAAPPATQAAAASAETAAEATPPATTPDPAQAAAIPQEPEAPPAPKPAASPLAPPAPDSYSQEAVSADEQPSGASSASVERDARRPITDAILAPPAHQDGPFLITSKMLPTGVEVNFPWRQRTAATVFTRGKALWVVFNAKADINLNLFKSILPGSITDVQMLDHPTHTIFVLHTDGTVFAKVSRANITTDWIVTLSQYRQIPKVLTAITPRPEQREPSIQISTLEYSPPIQVTDPMVGDELMMVPLFTGGEGVYPQRDYPELTLLETAQGIVMVRKADLARIKPLRAGLKVQAQGGISLSSHLPQLAMDELESIVTQQSIWFPYDSWKAEPGKFIQARQELEEKITGAGAIRANSLRLKLAQLYLANGLAYEALGLLDIIRSNDPTFYAERQLAAMHGAANFLADRFAEADADFRQPELNDRPEQKLWLSALKTLQEDRPRFDFLQFHRAYISKYPPAIREKLSVLAADNYINRKSFSKAMATFDTLSETGISDRLMPYIDFLLGKISAEGKKYKTAETLWLPLTQQIDNRFIRARAEFALVSMQYARGTISLNEAIDRLNKLRVVWRGDSLELSLLNYLGQLYIDDKNYLEGLRAWKELKTQFPTSPIVPEVAQHMADAFNQLFAEGKADALEPLQALSIFYEFRDLVPIGDAGDAMIQNLAGRLAGVDLLDRAAALLEHQIKFRQEREPRSKLAAQLALVYLLNKEPEKAIRILEVTDYGENPPALRRERTHLAAMALSETGDVDGALRALSSDSSRDGQRLKLNILWQHRRWHDAAETAESLLSQRDDMTRPLTPDETNTLLQLSIAYMFERETAQLQYLRTYFTPLLKEGPDKDIFSYVTDASGPIDPKKMSDVTSQIGRIEEFMKHYRDQVDARKPYTPLPESVKMQ